MEYRECMSRALRVLWLLLLLAGVSGCGSAARSPASDGVVPWVSRPLPTYTVPDPKLVRYPTSAPLCRGSQLRVSQGRNAVGLGNRLEELVFTNLGASPCLLRGYPAISAETPAGTRRLLHPLRGGTYFGLLVPADLRPGGHVFLDFGTSNCACRCEGGAPVRYRDLVFTLPHGGSVQGRDVSISQDCFLSMSAFGLPARYALPRAVPGTAGALRARLRLPASVRAGSTLRFVVTLSNPAKTPVTLDPCPGFTEGIYTSGLSARHSFALNCDSVRSIPAFGHVRYELRLAVPSRATPGPAKLGWGMNTPTGPSIVGSVRITAR
jgi:uncharacterized protein DUF4232